MNELCIDIKHIYRVCFYIHTTNHPKYFTSKLNQVRQNPPHPWVSSASACSQVCGKLIGKRLVSWPVVLG